MRRQLTCLLLLATSATTAHARAWDEQVTRAAQANFAEYLELLAIPDIAERPADIQRNSAFLEAALQRRGFNTQLMANPARRPEVFARWEAAAKGARTILFYIHFDGQPVIAEEWSQDSPFAPVVKQRDAQGSWREVPRERLLATPLDPELRVFARAAADDKAPIMMFLTAIDLMRSQGTSPPYNIKLILDSEEETGSPSLAGVVGANPSLFAADAVVILDDPSHASGRPTLAFGNRGIAQATLVVYGPRTPMHSGHFGNFVPNPAFGLARLLAGMKDDNGRVLIPGYYDGIALTAPERAVLSATGDDEPALLERVGVARPERVGPSYQEALQFPSLNVRGMAAGAVGGKAANIIPSEATAELDLRSTPEADGQRLFGLVKRYIERQGFHLVAGPPSDEERAHFDKLASFTLNSVEAAERMPMDSAPGQWAYRAITSATGPSPGAIPSRIRMLGGTDPTDILVNALHLPFIIVPTVNADNNQHTHDENLRIGNFISGTQSIYSLLVTPYP